MNLVQSEKVKTIEHYRLQSQILQTAHCQYWLATHKVLKKSFIMKKIKLGDLGIGRLRMQPSAYQRTLSQANLLKKLNLYCKPKFQKILRTNAHIYSIYDQIQGKSLPQHLQTSVLSWREKLVLMVNLTKQLQMVHCQGICLIVMTKQLINIIDGHKVVFVDWTLAINISQISVIIPYVKNFYEEIANFLQNNQNSAVSLDILNLAKVFLYIISTEKNKIQKKLKETLDLMLKPEPISQVSLKTVLKVLEDCIGNLQEDRSSTNNTQSKENFQETIESHSTTNSRSILKIKHCKSVEFNHQPIKSLNIKMSKNQQVEISPYHSINNKQSFSKVSMPISDHFKQASIKSISPMSKHTNSSSVQTKNQIYKKVLFINKMRNLSNFLLNLLQFVYTKDNYSQLCYMLLKKALFYAKQANAKTLSIESQNTQHQKLVAIVSGQVQRLSKLLFFQKKLCQENAHQQGFTKELQQQGATNDGYFNKKLRQFLKDELKRCSTLNPNQINDNLDSLFQTYLLSKKIQYHSYQRFWQDVYKFNFAHLGNQPYFLNQKRLGFRYIREKLVRIMQK